MTDLRSTYEYFLRTNFMVFVEKCFATLNPGVAFQDGWHLHALAELLRQVELGLVRNAIVNIPPRSGKSIMISIAFPAWLLGHDPRRRVICVSVEDRLVRLLAEGFRTVVESDWYQRAFPNFKISPRGNRANETLTTRRGFRFGVPLGGSVLGRGADFLIGDDVMSADAALSEKVRQRQLDQWATKFPSRLDDKSKGATIIVGQRLHEDDIVGRLTRNPEDDTQ